MVNHGYITTKKKLTAKRVLEDLQEINQRRFSGQLTIEDGVYGEDKGGWFVSYTDPKQTPSFPQGFNIWLTSQRRLEHRHSHGWYFYLELFFQEELGAKYDAVFTDEGHGDKWKPNPSKYSTYEDWLKVYHEHSLKDEITRPFANQMIQVEMKAVPKGMEGL
jgi:hypothetical protein